MGRQGIFINVPVLYKWLLLAGLFSIGLILASIIMGMIGTEGRTSILCGTVVQNLLAFAMPALVTAYLTQKKPLRYCGLSEPVGIGNIFRMFCIMIVSIPALNYLVVWNGSIELPESWGALERMLREMEANSARVTETLLGDTSVTGLITGVLCIGIITGLCEELFFRGGVQRLMISGGMNAHLSIWITAAIFSLLHFQFYGFVPRLLLGALFGYFFYSTGSLWVAAGAHMFNNSLVVITSWLYQTGRLGMNPDTIGLNPEGIQWIALGSGLMTFGLTQIYVNKAWQKRRQHTAI